MSDQEKILLPQSRIVNAAKCLIDGPITIGHLQALEPAARRFIDTLAHVLQVAAVFSQLFQIGFRLITARVANTGAGSGQSGVERLLDVTNNPLIEAFNARFRRQRDTLRGGHTAKQCPTFDEPHQGFDNACRATQHLGRFGDFAPVAILTAPLSVVGVFPRDIPQRHGVVGKMIVKFDHARVERIPGSYPCCLPESRWWCFAGTLHGLDPAVGYIDCAFCQYSL